MAFRQRERESVELWVRWRVRRDDPRAPFYRARGARRGRRMSARNAVTVGYSCGANMPKGGENSGVKVVGCGVLNALYYA